MDPQNPASFNHRTETLSTGRTYHFVDQLPDSYDPKQTPTLLCVHGFPDLWYGWRYQIGPWVRKGCRVVVPDMLGYGGTDKPADASEYSTKKLCVDLAALLDLLGVRQAVVVGHDWGAYTAGRFALWYPKRLLALVIMSVPYTPPSRIYIPVEDVAKLAPNLGYQADFANPATTTDIEANLERFLSITFRKAPSNENYLRQGTLKKVLRATGEGPSVLNDNEFQYYLSELKKGMTGPLKYYRTAKYRYDEEQAAGLPAHLPPYLPVLFLWGTLDRCCA
ncbi:Bifunctional epoxide hydrolase 2 [Hypsizygus marmoreus]|uniref:Bifunctional epoxide hydrolase 2 n=1 Tax=Hypsizygus marmoreus TaxID=39966 RepID=A0A369JM83_HYPMA|nr:Bifunctional epoxide hydrolase 2 [Hypsizygus marmoreus]